MRAGHQSGIIEGLESETRELKSHNEKLRSAYRKLNSDYERLRQCGAEVVGLMTGCPIQGGDPGESKWFTFDARNYLVRFMGQYAIKHNLRAPTGNPKDENTGFQS